MNWRIKALLQKVLSVSRYGDKLNHIPATLHKNYNKNVCNYQFYESLRKWREAPIEINRDYALEIGTGYTLISPIVLWLLGFNKVVSVDISNDVSLRTLKKQLPFLLDTKNIDLISKESFYSKQEIINKIKRLLQLKDLKNISQISNIYYIPNYTFEDVEIISTKYDYIVSQVVLEHIQPELLRSLFSKISDWLTIGGISVHTINFIDHFANTGFFEDKKISVFNFLKYSDEYWNFWTGNNIAYTNRLSYKYYLEVCEELNFNEVYFKGENYRDSRMYKKISIHPDIKKKYNKDYDDNEFIKYQRGTLILKK